MFQIRAAHGEKCISYTLFLLLYKLHWIGDFSELLFNVVKVCISEDLVNVPGPAASLTWVCRIFILVSPTSTWIIYYFGSPLRSDRFAFPVKTAIDGVDIKLAYSHCICSCCFLQCIILIQQFLSE